MYKETHLIKKKSKSFYFASLFLPNNIFVNCSSLYDFCRKVDDIADSDNGSKKKKLENILLCFLGKHLSNEIISSDIKLLLSKKLIETDCLIELVNGVLSDTKKIVHIKDDKQLLNYSYSVAGTVGLMMARLLGNTSIYGYRYAVDLGIAMQLTNIMRDIIEDAKINRVYLPKSWINLVPKEILGKKTMNIKKLKVATNKLYNLSELYYESSLRGIAFLPFRNRISVLLASYVYRNIGKKIIKNNYSNLSKREFLSFSEKSICLFKVVFIFIFNYKIHYKNYNHNIDLHANINKDSYLKRKYMVKTKKIDFFILGGGCSALSFINKVIDKKIDKYSYVIIEQRKKYIDDRSWCFWADDRSQYVDIIEKSWKSFSFNYKGKTNFLKSNLYKYNYIRSISFYNLVINKILKSPFIELRLNETVKDIRYNKNYFEVITNKKKYVAENILDTRPNLNNFDKKPFMYQSFFGYEIKFKKDIGLDINNAYLMHNMHSDGTSFYFEYILPIKKNTFIFELTVFSKKNQSYSIIEERLRNILKKYNNNEFDIIRKEKGTIPMGFINKKSIVKIKNFYVSGSLAGAVRASSGYAFLNIQEWAEQATNNLKIKGHINSFYNKNFIAKFLDKILLHLISSNSDYTPYIFYYFSKNIKPKNFVRFMIGKANIIDYFNIILSMPKKVFIKCLIKN